MSAPLASRFPLQRGSHPTRDDGMCAMEMVAWLAGEEHSDAPRCTCPVIAALVRATNDRLPSDEDRDRYLRPLVPQLVHTLAGQETRERRAYAACDFAVRRIAPLHLIRAKRNEAARRLASLPRVESTVAAELAGAVLANAAPELRTIRWLTGRCAAGAEPTTWLGAVATAADEMGSRAIWPGIVELVLRMVQIDRAGERQVVLPRP